MQDPRGAHVAMWTRGSATWAHTNPRERLHDAQAEDKWAKWIGPTGIVGPVKGRDKGGRHGPSGRHKAIKASALI